jgi:hypothetical protein
MLAGPLPGPGYPGAALAPVPGFGFAGVATVPGYPWGTAAASFPGPFAAAPALTWPFWTWNPAQGSPQASRWRREPPGRR